MDSKTVRTRIAPSPTGFPHIGTIYQAMFDYYFSKKYQGQFVVRIEDTDRARFVEGAEEKIYDSLEWFGLKPDEDPQVGGEYGPYRQSERLEIYQKHAAELVEKGAAYKCYCTKERLDELRAVQQAEKKAPMYDRFCLNLTEEQIAEYEREGRAHVIRLKIPADRTISFTDALVGKVEFDSNLIDDQVLIKSDGFPTYHLAVVVDDYLMKISHIFRGREWISSTPKHILLYEAFGWEKELPIFIHLPLLLNETGGGKLSKRDGTTSVDYYRTEGFLPEAILNYMANLVWNNPSGQEIFPMEEFMQAFHLQHLDSGEFKVEVTSQGPRFDIKKLEWMNGEYIRAMSDEELLKRLQDFLVDHPAKDKLAPLVPLVKERMKKLSDFIPLTVFLFDEVEYDRAVFDKLKVKNPSEVLDNVIAKLESLPKPWVAEDFEKGFRQMAEDLNISVSDMFQLLRVGFSGQLVTPPLFEVMKYVGEDETIKRIKLAKEFIEKSR